MMEQRDWQRNRDMWIRVLQKQTGETLEDWNARVQRKRPSSEAALREWLSAEGIKGYAQTLLVFERFGYPDFLTATANELIEAQYEDRAHLRPILDAVVAAAGKAGEVVLQARKTYVSLLTPRRTFARVVPRTRERVDLGLRLDAERPHGRLVPSRIHETMKLQVSLTSVKDIDVEVRQWIAAAYRENY